MLESEFVPWNMGTVAHIYLFSLSSWSRLDSPVQVLIASCLVWLIEELHNSSVTQQDGTHDPHRVLVGPGTG